MLDGAIDRICLTNYQCAQEEQHRCARDSNQQDFLHAYEDQKSDGRRSEKSHYTKIMALRNQSAFLGQIACQYSFHLVRIGRGWKEPQITSVQSVMGSCYEGRGKCLVAAGVVLRRHQNKARACFGGTMLRGSSA